MDILEAYRLVTSKNTMFYTISGAAPINELWNMDIANLDELAVSIDDELRGGQRTFRTTDVEVADPRLVELSASLLVLKDIIALKEKAEVDGGELLRLRNMRERLLSAKYAKENDMLVSGDIDDIDAKLEQIDLDMASHI